MVELTVELSNETFKKVRALSVLRSIPADQMDALLASLIDQSLNAELIAELGINVPVPPARATRRAAPEAQPYAADVSGIGVGLGDEDLEFTAEQEAAAKAEAERPPATTLSKRQPEPPPGRPTGVTEAALDQDMEVGDPEHEAKVDAPTFADQMNAEEAFGAVSGFAPPPPSDEPLPPSTRRKRALTGVKGRVIAATEAEAN